MQDVRLTAKTEFKALACLYTSLDELIDCSPKFLEGVLTGKLGSSMCRRPMLAADLVQLH